MKGKNLPLYGFIGLIIVFTAIYFISAYNMSFAFPTGEENDEYNAKIVLINKAASLYGEGHMDLFGDEKSIYMTVDDLIKAGYLISDNEEGDFKDPTSEVLTLNDVKVRITNNDGKIETKVLS